MASAFSSLLNMWQSRLGLVSKPAKPKPPSPPEDPVLVTPAAQTKAAPPPPPPSKPSKLLVFPIDIQLSVLYEWLDCYSISRLDVAFCSRDRQSLLDLLASPCPFSQWVFRKSFTNDGLLTWLSKR